MSWLTGWTYRKLLTVDQTKIDSDLTNFPVLVKLTEGVNFDFSKAHASLYDIRFTSDDELSLLDYELDSILTEPATYGSDILTGGTPSSSAAASGHAAADAVDNNDATFWATDPGTLPYSWAYDLGSGVTKTVRKLRLKPFRNGGGAYVKDFTLYGSNLSSPSITTDGDWTSIYTGQHADTDSYEEYEFANATAYRHYRVKVTSNWRSFQDAGIYELEMLEQTDPGGDVNEATFWVKLPSLSSSVDTNFYIYYGNAAASVDPKRSDDLTDPTTAVTAASADTDVFGNSAKDAFNNTLGDIWSSTNTAYPHWLKYDFGAGNAKIINTYTITSRADGFHARTIRDWTFQGSNDNSSWIDLDIQSHTFSSGEMKVFNSFSEGLNTTAYRYYRWYATDNNDGSSDWASITEAEMMSGVFSASDVWDSNHKGVWHLAQIGNGTSGEFLDSTANNNDGTAAGTVTGTTGKIGYGQAFANSQIALGDAASLEPGSSDLTWSFKVKLSSSGGNQCFIGRDTNGSSYFYFAIEGSTLRFRDFTGSNVVDFSVTHGFSTGVWYDLEVVKSGNNYKIYKDDTQLGSTATDSDPLTNRSQGFLFGGHPGISYNSTATMDEIRMSIGIARSDAWRKARINGDNDTLLSYGSEEEDLGTVVNPTELDAVLSVVAPTVKVDCTVVPSVIDCVTTALDPANVGIIVIVAVAVLDITAEVQNPSLSISPTISVSVLDMTASVQSPFIPQSVLITPAVFDLASTILNPSFVGESETAAEFATKVISFNPLVFVTDTNPIKVVKVDISDPALPTWQVYVISGVAGAQDIIFNSVFNSIYVSCENGKVVKINAADFNDYEIIHTGDANHLLKLASLSECQRIYAATDDSFGEVLFLDEAATFPLSLDIQCLQKVNESFDLDLRTIQGGKVGIDLQCLGTSRNSVGCDVRVIAVPFDEIAHDPILQPDFHVFINSVEISDVELDSIQIYHAVGEKSTASFTLKRRHDELNTTVTGTSSPITAQNPVQIYIKDTLEFDGKVARIRTNSENEQVEVTAIAGEKQNQRSIINIPLAGVNEKLHPYHCLVDNEDIYNPFIDPLNENPEYYLGVEIDLGKSIVQNVSRYQNFSESGATAEKVISGEFQPKQNWTYFWFCTARNFITNLTQATLRYVGTSPSALTSDLWEVLGMNYWYQRIFDDTETELGTFQIGSAPFKKISVRNGKKITKSKWVDQTDGLYIQKDEGYDYIQYAKDIAQLEFRKLKNISGAVLPKTSCDIELMIDGYYFYGLTLLNRINIDNTTSAGIYSNNNGFPVSVKAIQIDSASMRVSLKCDNEVSDLELKEIDALYPNEEDPLYKFPGELTKVSTKFDYGRFESVE